jgi:hypothetical protein
MGLYIIFNLWESSPPDFSTRIPFHSNARLPFNLFDDVPFEGESVVRSCGKPSSGYVVRMRVGSDSVFAGSSDAGGDCYSPDLMCRTSTSEAKVK